MTTNNKLYEIYDDLIKSIRKASDNTLEDEDIFLLHSISRENFKNIINDKEQPSSKNQYSSLLKNGVYTDFWKLIKVTPFLHRLHELLSIEEDNTKNKKKEDFFKTIFLDVYKSLLGVTHKKDQLNTKKDYYDFYKYFFINENMTKIKSIDVNNTYLVIPMILLNLYLECCIYMYANIRDPVNFCYDSTLRFGTFQYSNVPATFLKDIRNEIYRWIKQRCLIYNSLNFGFNKPIMYEKKVDGASYKMVVVEDINKFTHFNLNDFYTKDEIKKIKHLTKYRHELQTGIPYNIGAPNFTTTKDNFDLEVDALLKDNYIEIPTVPLINNVSSPIYLVYQAIHTYDQIIKEMINVRYPFLLQLRFDFKNRSNQKKIFNNAHKIVMTLKQYLNYPLTFQYKFNDVKACSTIMSENITKILFDKFIKLSLTYSYCKNNNIDVFKDPQTSFGIVDPSNDTDDVLKKLSIDDVFTWDKFDDDLPSYELIKTTLRNMHEAKINNHLSNDRAILIANLKTHLKSILDIFYRNPMKNISDTNAATYRILYGVDSIDDTKDGTIRKKLSNLKNILFGIYNTTNQINKAQVVGTPIEMDIDIINNEIGQLKTLTNQLCQTVDDLRNSLTEIFDQIEKYKIHIRKFRNLIDSSTNDAWINSFQNISPITNSPHIDYNLGKTNNSNVITSLFRINYLLSRNIIDLQSSIDKFNNNIALFSSLITATITQKDVIIPLNTALIANINADMVALNTSIAAAANPFIALPLQLRLNGLTSTLNGLPNNNVTNVSTIINSYTSALDNMLKCFNVDVSPYINTRLFPGSGSEQDLNNVVITMTSGYNIMKNDFIQTLDKLNELEKNVSTDFGLHRIKIGISNLITISYQSSNRCRGNIIENVYDINHQAASLELLYSELFKNNKGVPVYYNDLNRTDINVDDLIGLKVGGARPLLNGKLRDQKQRLTDIKLTDYVALFKEIYIDNKNIFTHPIDGGLFKSIREIPDPTIGNNYNISIYQMIDYFNGDAILNIGEKIFYYLNGLKEISDMVSIDTLIETLRLPFIIDNFDNNPNKRKYNYMFIAPAIPTRKYTLYKGRQSNKKNVNLIRPLFTKQLEDPTIDYLLNNLLDPISALPLRNVDDLYINSDDIHNRIQFNPRKLIDLINSFDEYKLMKFMFKKYRRNNTQISPDIHKLSYQKISFDDLHFYRCERPRNYDFNTDILTPYYCSYFSLGNVVNQDVVNFSNKMNDVTVDILELTNGKF